MKPTSHITFKTEKKSLTEIYDTINRLLTDKSNPSYDLIVQAFDYYENIISCMPGNVYWMDKDCLTVGCNQNVLEMFHLSEQSAFLGLSFQKMAEIGGWSQQQGDSFAQDTCEVIQSGVAKSNIEEPSIPGADGLEVSFLTTRVPLFNQNNEVIGIVGISTDITEVKKNQQALQKVRYQFEGAKLISNAIAHEIRTPLATIKSSLFGVNQIIHKLAHLYELACEQSIEGIDVQMADFNRLKEVLVLINRKVDESNAIMNMLLTKVQAIDFEFSDFAACSADQCIREALNTLTSPQEIQQKIHYEFTQDFSFSGQSTLIVHVIMNLLKNAVFYIRKANKGEITLWLTEETTANLIHVKDTGTGIPAEVLPHIFDSFFTTERSTGTGVGLAFCRMVMQSHRGEITCLSQEGEYAEFILTFPKIAEKQELS